MIPRRTTLQVRKLATKLKPLLAFQPQVHQLNLITVMACLRRFTSLRCWQEGQDGLHMSGIYVRNIQT